MPDLQHLDDLRRRIQRDPASIAFAQLAEECRRAGRLEEAIDVCRAGLAVHPGFVSARVTLGRALLQSGRLDDAQHEMEIVLGAAPASLAALRSLGEIHHRQGNPQLALERYRTALSLAPNDPEIEETVRALALEAELAARVATPVPVQQTAAVPAIPSATSANRTLTELEQFLTAIHVARTNRRAS